jgi:hypothetical protein
MDLKHNILLALVAKAQKNRILIYSWLPTGTYHKNLVIWIFFSLKSGEFGPFLLMKNSSFVYRSKFFLFQVEIQQTFSSKQNIDSKICRFFVVYLEGTLPFF